MPLTDYMRGCLKEDCIFMPLDTNRPASLTEGDPFEDENIDEIMDCIKENPLWGMKHYGEESTSPSFFMEAENITDSAAIKLLDLRCPNGLMKSFSILSPKIGDGFIQALASRIRSGLECEYREIMIGGYFSSKGLLTLARALAKNQTINTCLVLINYHELSAIDAIKYLVTLAQNMSITNFKMSGGYSARYDFSDGALSFGFKHILESISKKNINIAKQKSFVSKIRIQNEFMKDLKENIHELANDLAEPLSLDIESLFSDKTLASSLKNISILYIEGNRKQFPDISSLPIELQREITGESDEDRDEIVPAMS